MAEAAVANIWSEQMQEGLPPVILVSEMPEDRLWRMRAEQLRRYAGSLSVAHTEAPEIDHASTYNSLMEAVHAAAGGDARARRMVEMNARTDVIERTIKAGCVFETELEVDDMGRIMQHGQRMEDVYINALRFTGTSPQMQARLWAETQNGVRLDYLRRLGMLDDYYLVVVSRSPDDMHEQAAADAGFFTETASVAIQTATVRDDGSVVQQVAFVAGKRNPDADRHDAAAIEGMFAALGVEAASTTATELLGMPLLIHKSRMPHGVIDLVPLYDSYAGETFFGQDKPSQDYLDYLIACRQRVAELEPTAQAIASQLIGEANSINTPLAATTRLHQISQRHLVDQAFVDHDINPRVFGEEAAGFIEAGRMLLAQGQYDQFLEARGRAQETARSASCPMEIITQNEERDAERSVEAAAEDCDFISKECPVCKAKNVKTRVTKEYIYGSCGCRKKRS